MIEYIFIIMVMKFIKWALITKQKINILNFFRGMLKISIFEM